MAITLSREARERQVASIKDFVADHFEEGIGDLKASLLLDFCLEHLGPGIYNQAIADAQAYLQERVTDLGLTCYMPEPDVRR